jgi:hypothetical protein
MLIKSSSDQRLKLVFTRDPADGQPIIGLYSPFPGRPQMEVPPGCRLINFHDLLKENDTKRRHRNYEASVNQEIDVILRAKDTFFSRSHINIIIARASVDLQMLSGAIRSMVVEPPQQQSLLIPHRSLQQFFSPEIWAAAATPSEREVLDTLYRRSRIAVRVFDEENEINSLHIEMSDAI